MCRLRKSPAIRPWALHAPLPQTEEGHQAALLLVSSDLGYSISLHSGRLRSKPPHNGLAFLLLQIAQDDTWHFPVSAGYM